MVTWKRETEKQSARYVERIILFQPICLITKVGPLQSSPILKSISREGEKNLYHDTETQWPSEVPQMKEACTSLTELIVSVADRIVSALDA